MNTTAGFVMCSICNSLVETPANFCDMCGEKIITTTNDFVQSASDATIPQSQEMIEYSQFGCIVARVVISGAVIVMGFVLISSRDPSHHLWFLALLPIMVGLIVGAMNNVAVNEFNSNIISWTIGKLADRKDGAGKRHRFFYKPWHWLLKNIYIIGERIENKSVKAGFKATAYLYVLFLAALIVYLAVSALIVLVLFAIVGVLISFFTGESFRSSGGSVQKTVRNASILGRVRNKKLYNTTGIFREKIAEIDEKGKVYDTRGVFKHKIAHIDEDGNIQDTTGCWIEDVGEIDEKGRVYDTRGVFKHKIAQIDSDGNIVDTTGSFHKKIGRLE